ncbi:MAG: helicase-related protein, partial [Beijerinckiaceae bacterium]
ASLADSFLDNPVKVAVTPVATTAERVTQGVMHVPAHAKQSLLQAVLRDPAIARVLVFTRTKHGANRVVEKLEAAKIPADAIHGNKSQGQRERALKAFRDGISRVLVATDIAARGIDVDGVTHVINFELPNVPEAYVHRIGRTARAGASGIAISFCAPDEKGYLRDIERTTRVSVPIIALPEGVDFSAPPPREAGSGDERGPRQRQGQGRDRQSRSGQTGNGARNGQPQTRGPGGRAQDQRSAEPRAPRNPAEAARDPARAEAAAGDKRRRNDFKPHSHGQRVETKRDDGRNEPRGQRNGPRRTERNGQPGAQQGNRRDRLWSNH